jgi:glycosyltransferase involved in cell wall biosynthesis
MSPAAARRRLLFLTGYPAIGGPLPKLAPLMVDGFLEAGYDVLVLGWSAHSAGPESPARKIAGRAADLARVVSRMCTWRPQAVYVATTLNWPSLVRDLPLALALAPFRVPLVVHLHGSECERLVEPGDRAFTWLTRRFVERVAALLLLSTEEEEDWRRFAPGTPRRLVINPFVPAVRRDAPGPAHDPFTFLCVARLTREKGLFELVDAFAELARSSPCRLVIAGRGPEHDALLLRAEGAGVAHALELPGYVTGAGLDAVYRAADAFVLPSYLEGFPLTVMEAMGYALPVITTRIRGCADHLEEGVNALFVPARDPSALAAAMRRLAGDERLRESMGRANAARVGDFAPDKVMPAYLEVIDGVIRQARA